MSKAPSTFKRFVEVGRVVLVSKKDSEDDGKLAVITEIIDANRAIIDGPVTGVARQPLAYKYMILTPLVVKELPRAAGTPTVKKYFEKADIAAKWAQSSWAKKRQASKARKEANDFQRFEIMLLKKQRRRMLGAAAKKVSV
ncbi:60S ribosomal protein L14 [Tilletiaria anomala UBC 951]|uniref:60S ribosomal protein L14 n=1 Tax=Tilletiaria anomala (strain ATCC 24038 / CBS 436.72 / UBC 951) TaxID=1037660 RepID=A0A066VN84_TILAU|nr:60S ribosomal protein L14 [Tilletiaria anomala UBC 951]KDN43212.1 60S ribosomal protein L14 [Tilletiaria anomala UBC 951]